MMNFDFNHNRATIYRLDGNNVLRDVTNGIPTRLETLRFEDGIVNSVYDDAALMGDIINRREAHLNEIMPGKEGQRYLMNGKSSSKKENTYLTTMMNMIIQRMKDRQRLLIEKEERRVAKTAQSGMFLIYLIPFVLFLPCNAFYNIHPLSTFLRCRGGERYIGR
jgi:hypothetical protein